MKKCCYKLIVVVIISGKVFAMGNAGKSKSTEKQQAQFTQSLQGNGLRFTPNKGQIADMNGQLCPNILYKGGGAGADIYLRKTGISYVYNNIGEVIHGVDEQVEKLIKAGTITEMDEQKKKDDLLQNESIKIHRVDMDFEGCNKNIKTENEDKVDGYENYYYAHCPQGITYVYQYNKVTYKNIYNNIDITYYGHKENGIKYDLIVQPYADPNQIKLHWKGTESIQLNREGNLVIKTSVNKFAESIPKVYQIINGKVVNIKVKYILTPISTGEAIINFSFSTYNSSFPLVIDPWATYYGGNQEDCSTGIATDPSGNVVITGWTFGTFPIGAIGPNIVQQSVFGGGINAFVVKFSPSGTRLWATYYGANNTSRGTGIATDPSGNVVITGSTTNGFPTGAIAPNTIQQSVFGGSSFDSFVVKFSPVGSMLWATYYGGSGSDYGTGIATDLSGNVIITGYTTGAFPTGASSPNIVQQSVFGGVRDAFVVKFNPAGSMLWATYYGGNREDWGFSIVTDPGGNVVITGWTLGAFPTGASSPNIVQQSVFGGVRDAFVVKFNPAGSMLWATYYGGNGEDWGWSIVTDPGGNVVIAGNTNGAFPTGASSPNIVQQSVFGGVRDAFVVKFSPAGSMLWATYYGGNQYDWGWSVVTDANSNVYLLMETEDNASPNLINVCSYQPVFNGGSSTNPNGSGIIEDQLIVKFTPAGLKVCATYFGGTGEDDLDAGGGITVYGNSIYITGATDGGYPVTLGAFQTDYAGPFVGFNSHGRDAFVASLCINICESKILGLNYIADKTIACANTSVTFTPSVTTSCDTTGYRFQWTFTGGNPSSSTEVKPTVTFSDIGTHDVQLVVTTLCKTETLTKPNYITINPCNTCNLTGQFIKGTSNCTGCGCKEWIMVNAIGGTSPYNYLWSNGYTNRYKNQLCHGAYTINIKDKNGCMVNISLSVP